MSLLLCNLLLRQLARLNYRSRRDGSLIRHEKSRLTILDWTGVEALLSDCKFG